MLGVLEARTNANDSCDPCPMDPLAAADAIAAAARGGGASSFSRQLSATSAAELPWRGAHCDVIAAIHATAASRAARVMKATTHSTIFLTRVTRASMYIGI